MRGKAKVLIVDDEVMNVKLLEAWLQPLGYETIAALDGEDAIAKAAHDHMDLVLLDVKMPGINGFDVCREIRRKNSKAVPIIMVTALDETSVKVAGLEHGADDFLTKPVVKEELIARVKAHLRIKSLVDELESWNKVLEDTVKERTRVIEEKNLQLAESYDLTLDALIGALDVREHETGKHSLRVTFYTLEMAKAWGISGKELEEIAMGALLHDVGKIGISDNILLKPAKLDDREWIEMKKHPETGWKMIQGISFLGRAKELVLAHHERFDGRGYPRQLGGNDIYIGARFFSVADTLDAMTNDRPYRKALTFNAFTEELTRCSGSQFDPKIVEMFLSIPRSRWSELMERALGFDFKTLMNVLRLKHVQPF